MKYSMFFLFMSSISMAESNFYPGSLEERCHSAILNYYKENSQPKLWNLEPHSIQIDHGKKVCHMAFYSDTDDSNCGGCSRYFSVALESFYVGGDQVHCNSCGWPY